jgi:hypothetical protein
MAENPSYRTLRLLQCTMFMLRRKAQAFARLPLCLHPSSFQSVCM